MSAPQYISAEAIYAYCILYGINKDEDRDILVRMITVLDGAWMDDWIKKEKSSQQKSKTKR